jgi:hypothetical protein
MSNRQEKSRTLTTQNTERADALQQLELCDPPAPGLSRREFRAEARSCADSMTRHAQVRCQQRGLPSGLLDLLYEYGDEEHDKHGAVILYFSKKARRRMARNLGWQFLRCLGPFLNAYVVEADGWVITAGHRHVRITRH